MPLAEKDKLFLPKTVRWEQEDVKVFLDPEGPHWVAVDDRGDQLMDWLNEGADVGECIRRYAQAHSVETAKAWLHVHDFIRSLERVGFAAREPWAVTPYLGRAAYARPKKLTELWFHTNNICNLSCHHCLVSSAPWVQDWGIPTEEFVKLIEQAVTLGVDRFYFTGGEPFMRKDIFTLVETVTEKHGCELIVLTNATMLQAERAEAVKKLNREKVRFQVSVDGASPETNDPIRGKGSFEKAVAGLKFLAGLGFDTSITTAVTAGNLQDLLKITQISAEIGVKNQHLMWLHRRGRIVGEEVAQGGSDQASEANLDFPESDQLLEVVRQVKAEADRLGIAVDNVESIKQRVNARPGVKYDLGNACWDSLCIYSDGTVYPSAAMANVKPLALGSVKKKSLKEIWEGSHVAEAFRQASVSRKTHLAEDPFRYLTGGGDSEHSFWFNLDGDAQKPTIEPNRILEILSGPDPYYDLYAGMIQDAIWEIVHRKKQAVNRKSGYDVPRLFHAMGDGAIHCATDDLALTGEVDVRTLHSNCVLAFDVDKPRKLVREFYGKAAEVPQEELCCPTQFDESAIDHIPKDVIDRFYGCGSPVTMADLKPGQTMLDLGSGAGIDVFIAAKLVGETGHAIGVDMTDQMLEVAAQNKPIVAKNLGYENVEFRKGFLETVPAEESSVDLVTSNCVINLSPDKPKVFSEIWRILNDHGRLVIADIVSDRPVPAHLKVNPQLWGECLVGALTQEEFLSQLEAAGFYGLTLLKKAYWKTIEGFDFYSVTVRGFKFEKKQGCRFVGQKAIYLGPMKSVVDEEGHLFPRDVAVEVCTDTAAKLSKPPYQGSFTLVEPKGQPAAVNFQAAEATQDCEPGCC